MRYEGGRQGGRERGVYNNPLILTLEAAAYAVHGVEQLRERQRGRSRRGRLLSVALRCPPRFAASERGRRRASVGVSVACGLRT